MPYSSEKILIKRLKNKDLKAFEFIFKKYNRNLVLYANRFIHDMNFAEDIVQDIFYKLWESNFNLEAKPSILAYLMQSVRNQCLNHIKHKRIREKHKSSLRLKLLKYELDYFNNQENITKSLYLGEIEKTIEATINSLPPRCKKIFELSRFNGLKNKEIAQKLNISLKAVEKHMTKALKILRDSLKEYLD